MADTLQRPQIETSEYHTAPVMTAQESFQRQQKALEFHAASTTSEALENMSLHPGSFGELGYSDNDPRYFDRITASEEGKVSQAEIRPVASEVERQIEALSAEQQRAVIAEIACYLVAMREHHLATLALQAAAKHRQR